MLLCPRSSWTVRKSTPAIARRLAKVCRRQCHMADSPVSEESSTRTMLLAASFSGGTVGGQFWAASQTLAGPQQAGTWAGLQNFVGNFAGILAPAITGLLSTAPASFCGLL